MTYIIKYLYLCQIKRGIAVKKKDKILKAISNPVRIQILRYLCEGPSCVTLTNKQINISQPNLSQHLKVLKEADIIESKKIQTKRCYSINKPKQIKQLLKTINELRT